MEKDKRDNLLQIRQQVDKLLDGTESVAVTLEVTEGEALPVRMPDGVTMPVEIQLGEGESLPVNLPAGTTLPVEIQLGEGERLPVALPASTLPVEVQLGEGETLPVSVVVPDGGSLPVIVNAESTVNVRMQQDNVPLSGEALTVSAAGIVTLNIPSTAETCIITNPVDVRIAFGTDASATIGTLFVAKAGIVLTCREQLSEASIYWTAACTGAYVQYFS